MPIDFQPEVEFKPLDFQPLVRPSQTPTGQERLAAFKQHQEEASSPAQLGLIDKALLPLSGSMMQGVVQGIGQTAANPIGELAKLPYRLDEALGLVPPGQQNPATLPVLQPYSPPGPSDMPAGGFDEGLRTLLQNLGSSLSTPEMAAQIASAKYGAGGPVGQVAGAGFVVPSITAVPETVGQTFTAPTTAGKVVGAGETLMNLLGALGGRELMQERPPIDINIRPQDITPISRYQDVQETGGRLIPKGFLRSSEERLQSTKPVGQLPPGTRKLEPQWLVSVQKPLNLGPDKQAPGYIQVDEVKDGQNTRSTNPQQLRTEGYDVPDFEKLPQGKYTIAQAQALLQRQNEVQTTTAPAEARPEVVPPQGITEVPKTTTATQGGRGLGSSAKVPGKTAVEARRGTEGSIFPSEVPRKLSKERVEEGRRLAKTNKIEDEFRYRFKVDPYTRLWQGLDAIKGTPGMKRLPNFHRELYDKIKKTFGPFHDPLESPTRFIHFVNNDRPSPEVKDLQDFIRKEYPDMYQLAKDVDLNTKAMMRPEDRGMLGIKGDPAAEQVDSFFTQKLVEHGYERDSIKDFIENWDYWRPQLYKEVPDIAAWYDSKYGVEKPYDERTQYTAPGGRGLGSSAKEPGKTALEANKGGEGGFIRLPSPAQAVQAAKDTLKQTLDYVFGSSTDRSLKEHFSHIEAKNAGWSAPRHVAANEDVANKLNSYAAADIFTAEVSKNRGGAPIAYKKNALKSWIDAGVNAGLYQRYKKGQRAPIIAGQKADLVNNFLWVRKDLAPEVEQALNGVGNIRKAGAQKLLDVATELQLIGPTDVVLHTSNMYSTVVASLGRETKLQDALAKTIVGVKHLDALGRLTYNFYRELMNDPSTQQRFERLARINALRGESGRVSLLAKGAKKVLGNTAGSVFDTNAWIRHFDRVGRLTRDKMFDNLVKNYGIEDTELSRREFVNKMGQYNDRVMSKFQGFLQKYTSQFVVAGRTFNRNAFHRIMMSNEVRTANPAAYAKMKAMNMAGVLSSILITPIVANILISKAQNRKPAPFGRPGTPIGGIDTGKDGKDGRPVYIDLLQTESLRRGLRVSGLQALTRAELEGQTLKKGLYNSMGDVIGGMVSPWEGPPLRILWGGAKEYAKSGDMGQSMVEAMKAVNPSIESYFETDEKTQERGGFANVGKRLTAAVGYNKEGGIPTHTTRVQNIMEKTGGTSFEDRVAAEQQYRKDNPVSLAQEARAAQAAVRNIENRKKELNDEVPREYKGWLQSRGLVLPGYDDKISYKGTKVVMTPDELASYKSAVQQSDNETLKALKADKEFMALPADEMKAEFLSEIRKSRAFVHKEMVDRIQSGSLPSAPKLGSDKKKRFSFMQELLGTEP